MKIMVKMVSYDENIIKMLKIGPKIIDFDNETCDLWAF